MWITEGPSLHPWFKVFTSCNATFRKTIKDQRLSLLHGGTSSISSNTVTS
ncbi:hypothetical protein Lser_V15G27769 [Lactuca serriola]